MTETESGLPEGVEQARDTIDRVDQQLVELLAERMRAAQEIGAHKGRDPAAVLLDPEREARVQRAWAGSAQTHGLSEYFVGRILREILNYSRRGQEHLLSGGDGAPGQRTVRVGYQGTVGAYGNLAVEKLFVTRKAAAEPVAFRTFASAVDALERGELDYVLLPVENTVSGSVGEVNQLLARRRLAVVDEEIFAVEHCLAAAPGARAEGLRAVRSHPVALAQCHKLIRELRLDPEEWFDTAGAAESIRDGAQPSVGVICSVVAAERAGLEVLRRDVADEASNQTRFLLVARTAETCESRQPAKTSLLVVVQHQHGALARCLVAFAEENVNLTRLESRPRPGSPWEYMFFIDVEGHVGQPEVAAALERVREHANHLRVLGTYPNRAIERAELELPVVVLPAPGEPASPTTSPTKGLRHVSRGSRTAVTPVRVGDVEIGAERFCLIAGPCAVESEEQIHAAAAMVKRCGARVLRGGAFKPRSSPYSFQGLGFPGLDLLVTAGRAYGLPVVTEVLRIEDVERIAESADMLQVGARNMQNFALLKECGRVDRPILLKRGLSATIEELLQAAEYVMAEGNLQVVLCERGIRTFETATRNTLDVSAVPVLRERTHLPVIVDPSHAAGVRHLVEPLALAAAAVGADGLIIEAHPEPDVALCDKEQALTAADLERIVARLTPIVAVHGRVVG